MLIYDRFPDKEQADAFAVEVDRLHQLTTSVHMSQAESDKYDPFPFELTAPIVLVGRSDDEKIERDVTVLVKRFGGAFAGT